MFQRALLSASVAIVVLPTVASAKPATAAESSVPVPRDVLERYVGKYALNGTVLTVGLTAAGLLTAELSGQPPGPPLRAVSANEFAIDSVGARLLFEGEGAKAPRVRSRFAGNEVTGTRIGDRADAPPVLPRLGPALDAGARKEVVGNLGTALRERYIFPDVGERAAARLDAALAAGEYDGLTDPATFAARLSADVSAITSDRHLGIMALGGGPPLPPPGPMTMPSSEAGVARADILAGGIGYLEVIAFPDQATLKPVIDPIMTRLAESPALIIDLRRNVGGMPDGVAYLVSFMLPPGEPVPINTIVSRVAGTAQLSRETFTSQPTPVRFGDRPVYVLTSNRTFSGGEELAYDLKSLGRGVVVGERTGGGANPTGPVPLGNGLIAMIPVARAENAATGTNWEGRGVEPDIAASAADALAVALRQLGQDAVADIATASQDQVFAPRTSPLPGSEAALRAILAGVTRDPPDLSALVPSQAEALRPQLPHIQGEFRSLGALASVRFLGPGLPAGDEFEATFANGARVMTVILGPDRRLVGWHTRQGPPPG